MTTFSFCACPLFLLFARLCATRVRLCVSVRFTARPPPPPSRFGVGARRVVSHTHTHTGVDTFTMLKLPVAMSVVFGAQ